MNKYINTSINLVILGLLIYITLMVKEIHDETINDCPTCMIPMKMEALWLNTKKTLPIKTSANKSLE